MEQIIALISLVVFLVLAMAAYTLTRSDDFSGRQAIRDARQLLLNRIRLETGTLKAKVLVKEVTLATSVRRLSFIATTDDQGTNHILRVLEASLMPGMGWSGDIAYDVVLENETVTVLYYRSMDRSVAGEILDFVETTLRSSGLNLDYEVRYDNV